MTSGLLTQKPGREPTAGEIKCFTIENKVSQSGNDWIKVKNSTPDQGGTMYKILSAKPTGRTDKYGNISFNIELEPSENGDAYSNRGSVGGAMSKDDYWARKEQREIEKYPMIVRQHSQEMAIRWFNLKFQTEPAGSITSPTTDDLRKLIDWFQRDVGHVPTAPAARTEEPEPPVDSDGPPDEEPF